jgi:hypothetical protein
VPAAYRFRHEDFERPAKELAAKVAEHSFGSPID